MFVGKARIIDYLIGASLEKVQALLANIRLSQKGLPETNTLAYYEHLYTAVVKSFITLEPETNLIKFVRILLIFTLR
jgi:hypothetical protein